MSKPRRIRRRSPLILVLMLVLLSLVLGLGLAQAVEPPKIGTVDAIPERYKVGQQLYLQNCATCHIGVPPSVFPTQTWRDLLQDSQHYGAELKPLVDPNRRIVWNYLLFGSRAVKADERVPYRLGESQSFKALHPKVELPRKVELSSCVGCHQGAEKYDFRSLKPEWENAP
jgi:Dihaem cytochrome c